MHIHIFNKRTGSHLLLLYFNPFYMRSYSPKKPVRKISKTPYKVLDAPSLQDDYYLNLVDWSHNNVLSVALGSRYLLLLHFLLYCISGHLNSAMRSFGHFSSFGLRPDYLLVVNFLC